MSRLILSVNIVGLRHVMNNFQTSVSQNLESRSLMSEIFLFQKLSGRHFLSQRLPTNVHGIFDQIRNILLRNFSSRIKLRCFADKWENTVLDKGERVINCLCDILFNIRWHRIKQFQRDFLLFSEKSIDLLISYLVQVFAGVGVLITWFRSTNILFLSFFSVFSHCLLLY